MNVKKIVYQKLQKLTKVKFDNSSLVLEIGIDSLDLVELVTEYEDEFDIYVSDQELEKIKTVGDIINIFEKLNKT